MPSYASQLAGLTEGERRMILAGLSSAELAELEYTWEFWARPDQLPPPGDWRTWLLLGGRGSGKTRSAAEWVRSEIQSGRRRYLAIIGPTHSLTRKVQIEGPSGILATAPPDFRPSYEPSTNRIIWPNGAIAHVFSAEEPERLRGPNLDSAWVDELCAMDAPERTWDMLQMALRLTGPLGDSPRVLVSTTPKSIPMLKDLIAAPDTVLTRAKTSDNAANLDTSTLAYYQRKYAGSTLGRQELDGELLADLEGAMWNRAMLDACRIQIAPSQLKRIVIAVDPAGSSNATSDETGIVVMGVDTLNRGFVLADYSGRYSPQGWALRAVNAYEEFKADRIVAEANYGGAMVEATIRSASPRVPVSMVTASRGKALRAEPVVALYEQNRVFHVGNFPTLEDQMTQWTPGVGRSPDRLDALVWAATSLMIDRQPQPARFMRVDWMNGGGAIGMFNR